MASKGKNGVAPFKYVGVFEYTNNKIVRRTNTGTRTVLSGMAWMERVIIDPYSNEHSYLLSIVKMSGGCKSIRVQAQSLKAAALSSLLIENGLMVHDPMNLVRCITSTCDTQEFLSAPPLRLLNRVGWIDHFTGFYSGRKLIASNTAQVQHYYCEEIAGV